MPRRRAKSRRSSDSVKAPTVAGYDPNSHADGRFRYDRVEAELRIRFFSECLSHIEGELAGKPFALEPWQQAIVANLFGWKDADGYRRYRELFLYVPRKNGKTPLAAGIALSCLYMDGEHGAQIYCAAGDKEQAALLFRHASEMIRHDSDLAKHAIIYDGFKSIVLRHDTASVFKVLSAESDTKHGGNSHLVLIDELHVQPDRRLVDTLQTSLASANRRQPLLVCITTADWTRNSICNEKYDYACKVRDGIVADDRFLPVIYEAGKDDDWSSAQTWSKANPNLGVSISAEYLEREYLRAKELPSYENTFKRLHLNIRTEQDSRWLAIEAWDKCAGHIDIDGLRGEPCWGGLDLSATRDITALVLAFRDGPRVVILPFFWVPADSITERSRRDRVDYDVWLRQGLIESTPGNVLDYDRVRTRIMELAKEYDIQQIAIDRWNATQLSTQLMGDDIDVAPVGQGFGGMSAPTKELERLILGGLLVHGGNPVLRWMASNVTVEQDAAGNLKPSKRKSTERIDGIVATVMALASMMAKEPEDSIYESSEPVFI